MNENEICTTFQNNINSCNKEALRIFGRKNIIIKFDAYLKKVVIDND